MPFWEIKKDTFVMPENWEKLPSHERRDLYEQTASIFPIATCVADFIGFYNGSHSYHPISNIEEYLLYRQVKGNYFNDLSSLTLEQAGKRGEELLYPNNVYHLLFSCSEIVGYMKKNHAGYMRKILTFFLNDIYNKEYKSMSPDRFRTAIKGVLLPILNLDVLDVLLNVETLKVIKRSNTDNEIEEFYDHKNQRIESMIVHMDLFINKINPKTQEGIRMLRTLHLYEYLPQADMSEEECIAFKKEFEKNLSIFADEKIHIPLHFANALLKAHNEKENGFKLSASQLKKCEEALEKRKMLLQDIINLAPNYNKHLEKKLAPLGITDLYGNSIP